MRYLFLVVLLIFSGCGTKVFEPKEVKDKKLKDIALNKNLEEYTLKNLTFSTLKLKYTKKQNFLDDGIRVTKIYYDENNHKLGKFIKINKDLAINGNKLFVISTKKAYTLPYLIFSATKNKNLVALVFENGKYGIFDLNEKKLKALYDSDESLSVKYLHSSPIFYKDLVLFPLLTGNVAVLDLNKFSYIRTLNLSNEPFNDNVIYLKIVDNKLFMATPSKIILFNPNFLIDYKAEIKHVIDFDNFIYLFTIDGEIIKLNLDLKEIKKIKLPYASFFAPSVCNKNIWSVEKGGYLLKITPNLKVVVYKGNNFNTSSMLKIDGCKIYNEDKVFLIE